ncbi:MAG: helix-turn-helix domain-containing protein [Rikenellaceae bacterium]|jgi:excisionase family DNA binding protein|nr:helix-turn-helix domain-containing protein [Rikenellaceae bacterium]
MDNLLITKDNEALRALLGHIDSLNVRLAKASGNPETKSGLDRYLTDKEVCRVLHLNRRTLLVYRNEGRIPYFKLGRRVYYKASDIQRLMEEHYSEVIL